MEKRINLDNMRNHDTLLKTTLAFKIDGASLYSVHEVELKSVGDDRGTEYLLFTWISGPSVMYWVKEDYAKAQNYFDIGTTPIVMRWNEKDAPVYINDSNRNLDELDLYS